MSFADIIRLWWRNRKYSGDAHKSCIVIDLLRDIDDEQLRQLADYCRELYRHRKEDA